MEVWGTGCWEEVDLREGGGKAQSCRLVLLPTLAAILSPVCSVILGNKAHVSFGKGLGHETSSCMTTAGNYLGAGKWWTFFFSYLDCSLETSVFMDRACPWFSHWATCPELISSPLEACSPTSGQNYLITVKVVNSLPNTYLFLYHWSGNFI